MSKKQYINCHTHIFTKNHIPKYLGKSILPWPFYLIPTKWLIERLYIFEFASSYNVARRKVRNFRTGVNQRAYYSPAIYWALALVNIFLFLLVLTYLGNMFFAKKLPILGQWFELVSARLPSFVFHPAVQVPLILIGAYFSKLFNSLLRFIIKQLKLLPGPVTREYLHKMVSMGEYANYTLQEKLLAKLIDQYPKGTKFVVLPMDMHYMDAGAPPQDYLRQLAGLNTLATKGEYKDLIIPFIFADPRRISAPGSNHLSVIKEYLQGAFKGIKLYPALGYFPFEKNLLELYHFACERGIPIMTHTIRGTIYYRGKKKKEWNEHPILKIIDNGKEVSLTHRQLSNYEFSTHFTHPLNYECLLNPYYFHKLLIHYNDDRLNQLFDFNSATPEIPPKKNLSELKICFAHFGGTDEWNRFLNLAKNDFDNREIKKKKWKTYDLKPGNCEQLWVATSWYSLICNMMAKYPNVYADISYLLHDDGNIPLLKHTLSIDNLKNKVLFGSDYYVVRQKKSDKHLWINLKSWLTEAELDQIAVHNPQQYLNSEK